MGESRTAPNLLGEFIKCPKQTMARTSPLFLGAIRYNSPNKLATVRYSPIAILLSLYY